MLKEILEFDGTWRKYQKRVLDRYYEYKQDGKIHVVAAPGSGKTTLGIELIRLMDEPCLILVPTIIIREQWIARIEEAFLKEGVSSNEVLSQDLKEMKLITVTTYQAMHSAMKRYQGELVEQADEETSFKETVDFHEFDLLSKIKEHQIKTLCLDECHHLRSEWWKALEEFHKQVKMTYSISLTATPPYDSSPDMWLRYMNMCGQIDEEITIPELVKDKNLCPHQDYIYFNYPTKEELKKLKDLEISRDAFIKEIMNDDEFEDIVLSSAILKGGVDDDTILENPTYLSAILIYINERKHEVPRKYKKLLGYTHLEKISPKWIEVLLQNILYADSESYAMTKEQHQKYITRLKTYGLIENRKVTLVSKPSLKKDLVRSIGKCESIKDITLHEYRHMKEDLRLLILCDYIKKEYRKAVGDEELEVHALGVIPIFELLRRVSKENKTNLKIGVLCGTVVIIPQAAKSRLLELVENKEDITFQTLGKLDDESYVEVTKKGSRHCFTEILTTLFEEGAFEVLIGTKSLLGEGWDSPCVNSLILSSFVGSFMLSNQMRGRAIRTYSKDPNKTSNIWHLACIELPSGDSTNDLNENEDIITLQRRMDNFLGLHYDLDVIETGIGRVMDVTNFNASKNSTARVNKEMLERSSKRELLQKRWQDSLEIISEMEIAEEVSVNDKVLTQFFLIDFKRILITCILWTLLIKVEMIILLEFFSLDILFVYLLLGITGVTTLIYYLLVIKQFVSLGSPVRALKSIGKGIHKALLLSNNLETTNHRVESSSGPLASVVYLKGGSGVDQALFSKCVAEFFDVIDNQRYILYAKKHKNNAYGYFAIPDLFSKRKEDALLFASAMKPYVGSYEVVYTRNSEGRKILLKGRKKAFSNIQERTVTGKKVKNALE